MAAACVLACAPSVRAGAPSALPKLPVELSADTVHSTMDQETVAEGEVELRQGQLTLTADMLRYYAPTQWARAAGHVQLQRDGDRFSGTAAELNLATREGFVLQPTYHFERTGAGGRAERIDFVSDKRLSARRADYTSCPRDGAADGVEPDWVLSADRLDLDFEHNDGVAHGAVLHFLGVPILAAPAISFPATSERRSGWLPPELDSDTRGGVSLAVPYYWNLAPNYDLITTPSIAALRGLGLQAEFRYLQPSDEGRVEVHTLPHDRVVGRERHAYEWVHDGHFGSGDGSDGWRYGTNLMRASDDDYWKDFANQLPSLTRRLLPQAAGAERRYALSPDTSLDLYAHLQGWQVLQDTETILPPYQRVPQLGLRGRGRLGGEDVGLQWEFEAEANRFELADRPVGDDRPDGARAHLLGALSRPFDEGWGWFIPRASFNAASYRTDTAMSDQRRDASRVIPTLSADAGLRFDRDSELFGRALRQTLEPRLHYVNTPWREQTALPLFDTAPSDFNAVSIYADNPFSGIDRVADTHQVTLGATSRWRETGSGIERLRLGVAQRFLFRDQRLTPEGVEGDKRASDLLLFGSGTLFQNWIFDATVQYNASIDRPVRSIVAARYQPAPFYTLAGTYRYARDLSEQFELGWQWPLYRGDKRANGCGGTLYGVGRVNFSMRDNRVTDSIAGLEYDAGCWIARFVAQKVSTGLAESTTHWMLQLELVGLSRLGSNPLKVLKDNIPGYRLLRDDDAAAPSTTFTP
ncbi:LPS-assembly protein LptD [Ideonella sp.]|uniref:LPS-assembly protein LptD n=1 Tax=Ideonella sp. TaxID=1929293 RepID=UPI002B4722A7|nr:LPS assembly protein LptD [Ideonella sp.]